MDKKSLFLGILCIGIAFGLMMKQGVQLRENISTAQNETATVNTNELPQNAQHKVFAISSSVDDIGIEVHETQKDNLEEHVFDHQQFVTLENDEICVRFNSIGAGIQDVKLKKYPAVRGQEAPFTFNENVRLPALALSFGTFDKFLLTDYEIVSHTTNSVIFRKPMKNGIVIEREYRLAQHEIPYVLTVQVRFTNSTEKTYDLENIFVGLGSFPATPSDVLGDYLNFGYYDGQKAHFIRTNDFCAKSGFLGMGKESAKNQITGNDKIVWGSVKNQFFTGVFTPKVPGCGFVATPNGVVSATYEKMNDSVVGSVKLAVGRIDPGQTKTIDADFYVGPKDYVFLDRLGQEQDLVMQFGIFGFVSKLLLLLMKGIYTLLGNWGVTIIVLTLIVKLLLWPLTTAQVRSSRKMSKLQEPLKKVKEKYRDNPQKLQTETLKLFRDNRINPAAGCLPIFIQIPIFVGLYFMLRTTAEMRFAPFLWISDLSLPDTIAHLGNFPINILPLIMGVSMVWQMKVMPTPSADGAQKWVFKLMPIIFLVFCYNFPSALVLYWTIQNLLTIAQQIILNRKNDDALLINDPDGVNAKNGSDVKRKKSLGGNHVRS
ncbi:MAG: membrane protein insertase YidC [Puniceicoccales bacterium]|jgi:YidC/Oxa1 family membrane protein insertase|nr:membrane protein insertase YidC [Puniceicoccales bacterium]